MIIYKNKKLEIPVGLGPSFNQDSEEILNQNKTVDSSTNYQRVFPDAGYTGLGRVIINPYTLDSKTVDSSTELQIVTSDKDGLYRVVVNPYTLEQLTLDSSTQTQTVTGAYDTVTVNPYTLDEKTVDSSSNVQIVTSDADGLRQVTVNPYVLNPLEVDSSTATQEFSGSYGTVTVNPYTLDSSSAVLTENGGYTFTSNRDGLSRVDVSVNIDTQSYYDSGYSDGTANQKAKLESIVFTSNGVYSREDGWNQVEISVPGTIINNQDKTVDPSTSSQSVTFDSGYTGLGTVLVNPVTSSIDSNILAGNIKSGISILGVTGTFEGGSLGTKTVDASTNSQVVVPDSGDYGLSSVTVNPYTLQNKTIGNVWQSTLDDAEQEAVVESPDSGYDGLSSLSILPIPILDVMAFTPSTNTQYFNCLSEFTYIKGIKSVTINPVTSSIDSNISAGNIRNGVSILGVTGTYSGTTVLNQNKTVDSSTSSQSVTFDSGYTGLGTVTVNPYTLDSSSLLITSNGSYSVTSSADGLSRVDIDVSVPGQIIRNQEKTVDSSTNSQTVTYGSAYTGLSRVIVNPYVLDSKTIDASTNSVTVTSDEDGLSAVTVNAVTSSIDSNIVAGNIKKNVTILGVTGTYEGGSEPTPVPVEYISNENDLYTVFDTGVSPTDNTKIIARISFGGEGLGNWGDYLGVHETFALREWGGYGSASGEVTFQNIAGSYGVSGVYSTPGDLSIIRTINVGNNYLTIDSSTSSSGQYSGMSTTAGILIFAASNSGSGQIQELSSREMRVYSFAIYNNDTLVKNLIPYQDANSNGCFFDTISETFIYPLQGTPTVGPVAIYQSKIADASTNTVEVTADSGYEALSKVTINPVTASIDSNIIPSNIASGANILGVVGTFSGAIYHRVGYVSNNANVKTIYRNTGIIPTENTRIEATLSFENIDTGISGWGYYFGVTSGSTWVARESGGYGSNQFSVYTPGDSFYSPDLNSAPRTYTIGQVQNDYNYLSYGGFIDKRSPWSYTWSTGDSIFIWAANGGNDTVSEYSSRVFRLYEFKIFEGDTLVFHGVPVADNANHYALLDLVSNTLVEGDGELTGGGVYAEIDEESYIMNSDSSTGNTAYFDLGTTNYMDISDNTNIKEYIEVIAASPVNASSGKSCPLLGASRDSTISGENITLMTNVQANVTYCTWSGGSSSIYSVGEIPSNMNKYTIVGYYNNTPNYNGRKSCLYINGVPASVRPISYSTNINYNLYIFALNLSGTASGNAGQTKIYQIKYYNTYDGEVHVLVPAYNNGQYCFHDLISDTYIYAAGSTLATGHIRNQFLTNNGAIEVYTP